MKMSKALGPSGIVVEMIQAADNKGASRIYDLAAAINCNGKVLSYWEQSFIVCLYNGKGMHGKGKLTWSKADKEGHESPG